MFPPEFVKLEKVGATPLFFDVMLIPASAEAALKFASFIVIVTTVTELLYLDGWDTVICGFERSITNSLPLALLA